jgi:hypothetical protein
VLVFIAILSDSPNHSALQPRKVKFAQLARADRLMHCKDFVSSHMLSHLHTFYEQMHLTNGNNSADQHCISTRWDRALNTIERHWFQGTIAADSLHIAFEYYPDPIRALVLSDPSVFTGRRHVPLSEGDGSMLALGAAAQRFVARKKLSQACTILNTKYLSIQ